MRIAELAEIHKLAANINKHQQIIAALERYRDALAATREPAGHSILDIGDEIDELRSSVLTLKAELDARAKEAESYIALIPDAVHRTCLRMHYIKGLSWVEVSGIIGMSEEACRKGCQRSLHAMQAHDDKGPAETE